MKKRLAIFFAFIASTTLLFAESGTCGANGDNLTWELTGEVLTISGTGAMADYSIPNNSPWYESRTAIKKVILNYGITYIGQYAFYFCSNTSSVSIPNSVIEIGSNAFYYCKALTSVTIPSSVNKIGYNAFCTAGVLSYDVASDNPIYCSADGVIFNKEGTQLCAYPCGKGGMYTIPENVTTICANAFCGGIISGITIPNSVKSIEEAAFAGCYYITSVVLPDGLSQISPSTFSQCYRLTSVVIPSSVKTIGPSAFYACPELTTIDIPVTVTSIGSGAFNGCRALTSIVIPEGVTKIEDYTFMACKSLSSIVLPSTITSFGSHVFGQCDNALVSFYMHAKNPPTFGMSPFYMTDLSGCTLYVPCSCVAAYQAANVWNSFGAIQENGECYTITWKNDDGTTIDQTSVNYGQTPTHADPTKPADVEYSYTFAGWTPTITSVTGDKTYTATYTKTKNSYTITWKQDDGSIIDQTVVEYGLTPTHVDPSKPATAEYTYTFAGWSPATTSVTGDATYTATYNATKNSYTITWKQDDGSIIDQTTVEYGKTPTHVDPSKPATAEYTYTFAGWSPLIEPVTNNAIYTATYTAKALCPLASGYCGAEGDGTNLSWEFGCDSVLTINGTGAMADYSSPNRPPWYEIKSLIKQLVLNEGITHIGSSAFENCNGLSSLTIPTSVISIGVSAFHQCMGLTGDLFIPDNVISVGAYAFSTTKFTSVRLSNRMTKIAPWTFFQCHFTSVNIPNSVTSIGHSAFRGSLITHVIIPSSVTIIEETAFYNSGVASTLNHSSLYNYALTPQTINKNVFCSVGSQGVPTISNTTLYVPCEALEAYRTAEVWKDFGRIIGMDAECNSYAITWQNYDGSILKVDSLEYGATPTYSGASPTKPATAEYSYTFTGWSPAITSVTGDATYTATYTKVKPTKDVTIKAKNGKLRIIAVFPTSSNVTLQADANASATFNGWSDGSTDIQRTITTVVGDTTTASFDKLDYKITTQQ